MVAATQLVTAHQIWVVGLKLLRRHNPLPPKSWPWSPGRSAPECPAPASAKGSAAPGPVARRNRAARIAPDCAGAIRTCSHSHVDLGRAAGSCRSAGPPREPARPATARPAPAERSRHLVKLGAYGHRRTSATPARPPIGQTRHSPDGSSSSRAHGRNRPVRAVENPGSIGPAIRDSAEGATPRSPPFAAQPSDHPPARRRSPPALRRMRATVTPVSTRRPAPRSRGPWRGQSYPRHPCPAPCRRPAPPSLQIGKQPAPGDIGAKSRCIPQAPSIACTLRRQSRWSGSGAGDSIRNRPRSSVPAKPCRRNVLNMKDASARIFMGLPRRPKSPLARAGTALNKLPRWRRSDGDNAANPGLRGGRPALTPHHVPSVKTLAKGCVTARIGTIFPASSAPLPCENAEPANSDRFIAAQSWRNRATYTSPVFTAPPATAAVRRCPTPALRRQMHAAGSVFTPARSAPHRGFRHFTPLPTQGFLQMHLILSSMIP